MHPAYPNCRTGCMGTSFWREFSTFCSLFLMFRIFHQLIQSWIELMPMRTVGTEKNASLGKGSINFAKLKLLTYCLPKLDNLGLDRQMKSYLYPRSRIYRTDPAA